MFLVGMGADRELRVVSGRGEEPIETRVYITANGETGRPRPVWALRAEDKIIRTELDAERRSMRVWVER